MTDFDYEVLASTERFQGSIFRLLSDQVSMPGGGSANRDYTQHMGAVAIVAVDDHDRVVLVRQYRHPLRAHLWEIPAGLCDVDGEAVLAAAQRELAEETDTVAAQWEPLLDLHSSPGYSDERIRVFLARGLSPVDDADRHTRAQEEADMTIAWFSLDEAVAMARRGEITNAASVAGLLAARFTQLP